MPQFPVGTLRTEPSPHRSAAFLSLSEKLQSLRSLVHSRAYSILGSISSKFLCLVAGLLFFSPGLAALIYLLGLLSRAGQEPFCTSRSCAEPQGSPSPLLCQGRGGSGGRMGASEEALGRGRWSWCGDQGFLEKHTLDRDADATILYHGPAGCQALPTLHIHDIVPHQWVTLLLSHWSWDSLLTRLMSRWRKHVPDKRRGDHRNFGPIGWQIWLEGKSILFLSKKTW